MKQMQGLAVMSNPNHHASRPYDNGQPPLGLRPKDAARALGIGERLLWSKTNAGEIPYVRIGKAIIYPVHLLRDWLTEQAEGGDQ